MYPLSTYPEAVLIDMARSQARGQDASYFELMSDLFGADTDWIKRSGNHTYLLIESWFVCEECSCAEQFCDCDGDPDKQMTLDEFDSMVFGERMPDEYGWGDWYL